MKNKILITSVITFLFLYLINILKSLSVEDGANANPDSAVWYVLLYLALTLYFVFSISYLKIKNRYYISLLFFLVYAFIVNNFTILLGLGNYSRIAHFLTAIPIMTLLFFSRYMRKESAMIDYSLYVIAAFVVLMGITYYVYRKNVVLFLNNENVAINTSYFLMYSLPVVMCVRKNIIKYVLMILILLAVMLSFKRAGTGATLIAIAVYVLVDKFLISKKSLKTFFGLLIIVGAIVYAVLIMSESTEGYLLERFTQAIDSGDSRDDIRVLVFKMILNSDFFPLLFGHGYDMVMNDSPLKLAAHNDFLEITYDYGLIGLIFYLNIYIQLFRFSLKLLKAKSRYAAPMFASLAMMPVVSFFSHIFLYHHYSSLLILFWGIVIGDYQNERNELNLKETKTRENTKNILVQNKAI